MNNGYKMALNKFSDRTSEEKRKSTGLLRRKEGEKGTHPFPYDVEKIADIADELPADYDLRLYGYVSPVRGKYTLSLR